METLIEINRKDIDSIAIFEFTWELDETNADNTFESLISEIWDYNGRKIIFNFKWLTYLNSKSIWYIADIFSNLEDNNWNLYISNCNEQVKDILDIVGITGIISAVNTEEEAIESIK